MILEFQVGVDLLFIGFWFTHRVVRVSLGYLACHILDLTSNICWYRRVVIGSEHLTLEKPKELR